MHTRRILTLSLFRLSNSATISICSHPNFHSVDSPIQSRPTAPREMCRTQCRFGHSSVLLSYSPTHGMAAQLYPLKTRIPKSISSRSLLRYARPASHCLIRWPLVQANHSCGWVRALPGCMDPTMEPNLPTSSFLSHHAFLPPLPSSQQDNAIATRQMPKDTMAELHEKASHSVR
jgi:hypothetical protein